MKRWLVLGGVGGVALLLVFATLLTMSGGTAGGDAESMDLADRFVEYEGEEQAAADLKSAGEFADDAARPLPVRVSSKDRIGEDAPANEAAPALDPAFAAAIEETLDRDGRDSLAEVSERAQQQRELRREAPPPEMAEAPTPEPDDERAADVPLDADQKPRSRIERGDLAKSEKKASSGYRRARRSIVAAYDPTLGEPITTLPSTAYFQNTYLGGNAEYVEQLRRLDAAADVHPWRAAALPPQPFDRPDDAGLALSAAVDRPYLGEPSRVLLQVGLEGSARAGWRRPPLDVVVVVDSTALERPARVVRTIGGLITRLDGADRLAVRRVGEPLPVVPLSTGEVARRALLTEPDALLAPRPAAALDEALSAAGRDLDATAESARIPGTGVVLLLVSGEDPARAAAALRAAHRLTTEGVTVSVVEYVDRAIAPRSRWWAVAHSGHGGHHRARTLEQADAAVEAELDRLARVVARLVRLNVRLAPGVKAIRVLGSRLLRDDEVRRVKAREKAVDERLSRTLGVTADRGDDDDGLQTVIPYFLGQDSHVVLIELWVAHAGPIADVSVRYKDMVRLDNGRAATSVSLGALPRPPSPINAQVLRNAQGVAFAEALGHVSLAFRRDDGQADAALDEARRFAVDGRDHRLLNALRRSGLSHVGLVDAYALSARRRLGVGHDLAAR